MYDTQKQLFNELNQKQAELTKRFIDYWLEYSFFDSWQFWCTLAMLVVPLILLYFKMDRSKALLLGFFGFNVHVWFTYIDTFGVKLNFWNYPYQVIPIMGVNFGLDVSFIPVLFMFLYQWIINNDKNFYLYFTLLSLTLAFGLKPLLVALDLFQLTNGANYFHLLLGYLTVMLMSKWTTNLFLSFKKTSG
ncbi:CBO0543 family protein [Aquibacillus salsiterrae]|uniref:Uncharacterized protein n=1 Tax=Aquibacillus salsiterrae TaxID=2950439 RepID=A0A9X4AH60_9BACI|nr:CBO0543 family protein [Aquibacillus salsiterrae]MDC3418000.1 hypothetical protein [Aquibacillus salsiterrae]